MQQNDESRRSFLKQVLAGSAVVAGAAMSEKKARAGAAARAKESDEILYRESKAFTKYYDSLR